MAIERIKGHGLRVIRDSTPGEPNVGTCTCGWSMRQRSRAQVREAYRQHLTMLASEHEVVDDAAPHRIEKISEAPSESEVTAPLEGIGRDDLN